MNPTVLDARDFVERLINDTAFQTEVDALQATPEKLGEKLRDDGYRFTEADLHAAWEEKAKEITGGGNTSLSDAELENVSGGVFVTVFKVVKGLTEAGFRALPYIQPVATGIGSTIRQTFDVITGKSNSSETR